jgi:hypothetical protein
MRSIANRRTTVADGPALFPAAVCWLLFVVGFALVCACGQATPRAAAPAASPATPTLNPTPTATAVAAQPANTLTEPVANTPAAACSTSGPASASWAAPWNRPAGPAIVAATATGDTFTLTFDHGTPAFEVSPTSNTAFIRDPKGDRVVLAGTAGVAIHLTAFRGDVINFQGTTPRPPAGSLLREVREIGDFEGEVNWAAGLAQPACAAVTSSGSTITFHFVPTTGKG